MTGRPNVLLITADQWRADCLGLAGHPVVRTPNLDRLAGRGTAFLRHFGQASPCGPSRASLYTGLYQMNHRVVRNGTPLDSRHDNIALAMRRLGYRPTLFGYTDQAVDPRTVPPDSPWLRTYEGILPGFDVGLRLSEHPEPWLAWLAERGIATPDPFWAIYSPAAGPAKRPGGAPARYAADETETAFLAGVFLSWLEGQGGDDPWFAHVSFLAPHPPFIAPEPYNAMYPPGAGPACRRAADRAGERIHPAIAYWQGQVDQTPTFVIGADPVSAWSDADFAAVRSTYWGMISEVDAQIGRIVDALAASGADRHTVIAFTSDHGELLGDHWMLGKAGYHDQAFRVPLIVADPRRPEPRRVTAFTEAIDVMPTLIELAGGVPPGHLDGRSLAPFMAGAEPHGWRDAVHFEYDFREVATGAAQRALGLDLDSCSLAVHRGARFKYVHFAGLVPLLFDLDADPGELTDLAADPAYAGIRLASAEKLLAWRARHLDRTWTGVELTADGPVDGRRE